MPNISAGGGGPSSARNGDTGSNGGFDGSGWMLNFGGTQSNSDNAGQLAGVGVKRDRYGLPSPVGVGLLPMGGNPILQANTGPGGIPGLSALMGGGGQNSLLLLGLGAVVVVMLLRR